jgi:cytochrome c-type biogenesis protein CcmH
MLFWIIIAVLTAGLAAILLFPLLRGAAGEVPDRAGEAAVYRDQMKELERDRASGLIGAEDADYARAEIGRRLLAASAKAGVSAADGPKPELRKRGHALATAFIIVILPAIGLCLYLATGSPGLPSQPLQARLENPGNNLDLLVAKAERHLAQNPNDGAGWELLAPIYLRGNRLGDADLAFRNAIRLLGETPERLSGLGETLVAASDGVVTDDARTAFARSVALQADNPRAKFYLALALEQAGKAVDARAAFEVLAQQSPPGAPWLSLVGEHIVKNGGAPAAVAGGVAGNGPLAGANAPAPLPGPTQGDIAAAQNLSAGDQQQMIRGMVESLDAKLREEPNNLPGWLRLVRSYMVLNDRAKAAEALQAGLKTFPAAGADGQQLVALAGELGLPMQGEVK